MLTYGLILQSPTSEKTLTLRMSVWGVGVGKKCYNKIFLKDKRKGKLFINNVQMLYGPWHHPRPLFYYLFCLRDGN